MLLIVFMTNKSHWATVLHSISTYRFVLLSNSTRKGYYFVHADYIDYHILLQLVYGYTNILKY